MGREPVARALEGRADGGREVRGQLSPVQRHVTGRAGYRPQLRKPVQIALSDVRGAQKRPRPRRPAGRLASNPSAIQPDRLLGGHAIDRYLFTVANSRARVLTLLTPVGDRESLLNSSRASADRSSLRVTGLAVPGYRSRWRRRRSRSSRRSRTRSGCRRSCVVA
jgi:hypothetical protein